MKGYLSIQETAKRWGISVRWVNQYILEGRVPGCERFPFLGCSGKCGETEEAETGRNKDWKNRESSIQFFLERG